MVSDRDELLDVVENVRCGAGYGTLGEEITDAILAAGYRRVTTDPETVERMARAMRQDDVARSQHAVKADLPPWEDMQESNRGWYRRKAHAALSALTGRETDHA